MVLASRLVVAKPADAAGSSTAPCARIVTPRSATSSGIGSGNAPKPFAATRNCVATGVTSSVQPPGSGVVAGAKPKAASIGFGPASAVSTSSAYEPLPIPGRPNARSVGVPALPAQPLPDAAFAAG